jgi:filamin
VKFADKHIPGSPFAAEIFPKGTDLGDAKRERPVVGKPCDVKLDIPDVDVERDFEDLTGTLRRPGSNKEEPVELSKNPDGTVGVTFTPYEPGVYLSVPSFF